MSTSKVSQHKARTWDHYSKESARAALKVRLRYPRFIKLLIQLHSLDLSFKNFGLISTVDHLPKNLVALKLADETTIKHTKFCQKSYLVSFPSSYHGPVVICILIEFSFPPHQIALLSLPPIASHQNLEICQEILPRQFPPIVI